MNALNPVRTVGDQISEAVRLHAPGTSREEGARRAEELLERVGIGRRRAKEYPHTYSGGMRQRAMIALALACDPDVIVADEPTTALDVMIQAQILELLSGIARDFGMAIILVTHDLGVVAQVCDRIVVMYGGGVAEENDAVAPLPLAAASLHAAAAPVLPGPRAPGSSAARHPRGAAAAGRHAARLPVRNRAARTRSSDARSSGRPTTRPRAAAPSCFLLDPAESRP